MRAVGCVAQDAGRLSKELAPEGHLAGRRRVSEAHVQMKLTAAEKSHRVLPSSPGAGYYNLGQGEGDCRADHLHCGHEAPEIVFPSSRTALSTPPNHSPTATRPRNPGAAS